MSSRVFRLAVRAVAARASVSSNLRPFSLSLAAMGGTESKGGEGWKEKRSTKKAKETAAVATAPEAAAPAAVEKASGSEGDEYIECTVAKASEFGENE